MRVFNWWPIFPPHREYQTMVRAKKALPLRQVDVAYVLPVNRVGSAEARQSIAIDSQCIAASD